MQIKINVEGDIQALMRREVQSGRLSVTGAMGGVAKTVKAAWRAQITSAGLGVRLGNAVRDKVYPEGRPSMNASAFIYVKGKTAPVIVGAHDEGPLIRAASGIWLAIPLPAAGKGARGTPMTPGAWENKTGRQLRFVYRAGKNGLLVDDGTIRPGNVMVKGKRGLRAPSRIRNRTVPIFALVRQVKLPKRLNIAALADQGASAVASRIVSGWKD